MRLCYGPSKRLNFVQFMVFAENSTNLGYWKIDTSDSLPILKNANFPHISISGGLRYCSLYAKFFFLDCFREARPSFGNGKNYM